MPMRRRFSDRLRSDADDAPRSLRAGPDPDSPLWTPELHWLLRSAESPWSLADRGHGLASPGPNCRGIGVRRRLSLCNAYLAPGRRRHGVSPRDHGIATRSWRPWRPGSQPGGRPAMRPRAGRFMSMLADGHARGKRHELGPSAHQRGDTAISLSHPPESGPILRRRSRVRSTRAVRSSRRHFPTSIPGVSCGLVLL